MKPTVQFILSLRLSLTFGLPGRSRSSSLGDMPVSPTPPMPGAEADPLVSLEEGETGGTGRFAENACSWASYGKQIGFNAHFKNKLLKDS